MAYVFQIAIFLAVACWSVNGVSKLKEQFGWKIIDFEFPSDAAREQAIEKGEFTPENVLPLGLERWKNKLFVTFPRWRTGTGATLAYVDLNETQGNKSPKLKPYPNWEAHKIFERNGVAKIGSVFRVNVDVCDRLWIIDMAIEDIKGNRVQIHEPRISVYDLNTDKLVKEFVFTNDLIQPTSTFGNIIVDVTKDTCDKAFAYVADLGSNALISYDSEKNEAFRVSHFYFNFDPIRGDYNIGGINLQLKDGLFGLALSPVQSDGYRTLYFHPLSTYHEFAVSTRVIRDKSLASSFHEYEVLGSRGTDGQASGSSFDESTAVLFYGLVSKNGVGCWNAKNKAYTSENNALVDSDPVEMIFPNDLRLDKTGSVWVLTDRVPQYFAKKLNFSDVNFRIHTAPVSKLIRGTVCEHPNASILRYPYI